MKLNDALIKLMSNNWFRAPFTRQEPKISDFPRHKAYPLAIYNFDFTEGGSPMEASEQQHEQMKRQKSDASVTSSSSSNSSSCDSGYALPSIEDRDMSETSEVEQPARSSEKPPLAVKPCTAKPPGKLWVPILPISSPPKLTNIFAK
jgi:hypothetical protein